MSAEQNDSRVITSAAERMEMVKIIRARARVAKEDAAAQQAIILARAEAMLSAEFREDDKRFRAITEKARIAVEEAAEKINAECDEAGIPVEFRPGFSLYWFKRGANADPKRRAELRLAVKAQAEAAKRRAQTEIERWSVAAQEQAMAGAFTSIEAREFLDALPSPADLMPDLDLSGLGLNALPTAEIDDDD